MVSFENPIYTTQTGNLGPLSLLESVKHSDKKIKFYQASSSEMYGGKLREPLNEYSSLDPKSPYAVSKVFAHNMTKMYRESYDLFCTSGILFNHESPLRGQTFVTRKITRALGRIVLGIQEKLTLGNLDASRDWGFAGDYVEGMWMMMQHDKPDDWVLATGETYTVKEFLKKAFDTVNLSWEDYVVTSEKYLRPNEVDFLLGDPTKAKNELNWDNKTSFDDLVIMMVESDIELAKQEKVLFSNNLISPTWEFPKT
jgi:GDPmannose 4,6-dehydratase